MDYFAQQLINGITLGAIYGLIAIGYTMVYGIVGMINFAHGDVFMAGSFLSLIALLSLFAVSVTSVPLALVLALLAAMGVNAVLGWSVERIAYRPLRGSFRLAPLITAIGISITLQNIVQLTQGARSKSIPPLVSGQYLLPGAVTITVGQVLIVVTTLAIMTVFSLIIARTELGRVQRACEQDRKMAALCGVNVDRTISLTFVIGSALAAAAGMMVLVYYGVISFTDGFVAGIKAFTAAVLGGIGSLPGAMIGGLAIGLIEVLWAGYVSAQYKDVAAFSILVIVLVVMPSGLLGRAEIEKV